MKTIEAKQFHMKPSTAYRYADLNGSIKINHDRYPDKIFVLTARDRREGVSRNERLESFDERLEEFINTNSFVELIENSEDAFVLSCGMTRFILVPRCIKGEPALNYRLEDAQL